MYIPEANRVEDRATALAFMQANPFAILISTAAGVPFATHLPVVVRQEAGELVVRAHVARANPHWKSIASELESLLVFHGPHAYVSPALYENAESVPTWNYGAVHVRGRGRILEDDAAARDVLHELIARFDSSYRAQWESLSPEYQARMVRHIVAFEIAVTRVEAKFKLSQNRTRVEQENVIRALADSEDSAAAGVAALMRGQGLGQR